MLAASLPVVVWLYIGPWGKVGLGVGLEVLTFHECFHVHCPGHIYQGTGGTFGREEDVCSAQHDVEAFGHLSTIIASCWWCLATQPVQTHQAYPLVSL